MSIVLRGVEMPKDEEILCVNIYPDGKVCINLDLECKRIATAVHVPSHRRLVDADVLSLDINAREDLAFLEREESEYSEGVFDGLHEAAKIIYNAPTIIEAE